MNPTQPQITQDKAPQDDSNNLFTNLQSFSALCSSYDYGSEKQRQAGCNLETIMRQKRPSLMRLFTHGKGLSLGEFSKVKNQQIHAPPSSDEESELEITREQSLMTNNNYNKHAEKNNSWQWQPQSRYQDKYQDESAQKALFQTLSHAQNKGKPRVQDCAEAILDFDFIKSCAPSSQTPTDSMKQDIFSVLKPYHSHVNLYLAIEGLDTSIKSEVVYDLFQQWIQVCTQPKTLGETFTQLQAKNEKSLPSKTEFLNEMEEFRRLQPRKIHIFSSKKSILNPQSQSQQQPPAYHPSGDSRHSVHNSGPHLSIAQSTPRNPGSSYHSDNVRNPSNNVALISFVLPFNKLKHEKTVNNTEFEDQKSCIQLAIKVLRQNQYALHPHGTSLNFGIVYDSRQLQLTSLKPKATSNLTTTWSGAILRGLPKGATSEKIIFQLQTKCKDVNIMHCSAPVMIKADWCCVVRVQHIEDAEKLTRVWNMFEFSANNKLRVNVHPYSFRKRPQPETLKDSQSQNPVQKFSQPQFPLSQGPHTSTQKPDLLPMIQPVTTAGSPHYKASQQSSQGNLQLGKRQSTTDQGLKLSGQPQQQVTSNVRRQHSIPGNVLEQLISGSDDKKALSKPLSQSNDQDISKAKVESVINTATSTKKRDSKAQDKDFYANERRPEGQNLIKASTSQNAYQGSFQKSQSQANNYAEDEIRQSAQQAQRRELKQQDQARESNQKAP